MTPKERLLEDLLADSVRELAAREAECEELKIDNAILTVQFHIAVLRLKKMRRVQ
jgi:hypothetical protein